jgi:hydrogenase maturation protease
MRPVHCWTTAAVVKARTLIIGYGNPLREDDGMGWRAAELLEQQLPAGAAEIIECHQLTPELAANLADASVVVFLDAACDQEPGAVCSAPVLPEGAVVWSHYVTPGQLLTLSEQLGGKAPQAFLIRGGIQSMNLSEGLTELGEKTASQMANLAYDCIQELLENVAQTLVSAAPRLVSEISPSKQAPR